jgi:phenylalanyl-tRNA synthetase alpha subunit
MGLSGQKVHGCVVECRNSDQYIALAQNEGVGSAGRWLEVGGAGVVERQRHKSLE